MFHSKSFVSFAAVLSLAAPASATGLLDSRPLVSVFEKEEKSINWIRPAMPPASSLQAKMTGIASWYGPGFHHRQTANGEIFNAYGLSAAHRTIPMGSRVRVTNLANGRSVIVRINDYGPSTETGRSIDLSQGAAAKIGMISSGVIRVRVEVLR